MLNFIQEKTMAEEGFELYRPEDGAVSGQMLGHLAVMVVDRVIEQINWEDMAELYLSGLVDDTDLGLLKRACRVVANDRVSRND